MENAIRKENTYCGIEQSVPEGKVCFCSLDSLDEALGFEWKQIYFRTKQTLNILLYSLKKGKYY